MEGNAYNNGGSSEAVVNNTTANGNSLEKKKNIKPLWILVAIGVLAIVVTIVILIVLNKSNNEPEADTEDDASVCDVESVINEYKLDIMDAKTDEEKFNAYLYRADMLSQYGNLTGCNTKNEALSDLEMAEHFAKTDNDRSLVEGIRFYIQGSKSNNQDKPITMGGE